MVKHAKTSVRDDSKQKQWGVVEERRGERSLEESRFACQELQKKIDALKAGKKEGGSDYNAQEELKSLNTELKEERKKITRLEGQLAEALANKESLSKQLSDINAKIAALPKPEPAPPASNNSPLATSTTNKSATDSTPVSPDEDPEELKARIKEQTDLLKVAQDKCAALNGQISERSGHLKKLEGSVAELEQKKKGWEEELRQLREGKEGFEAQMEKTKKELEAEEKKVEKLSKLEAQAETAKNTLKGLKAELGPLQTKLASLEATHKKLTDEAEAQNAQVTKARADLKLFRKKHSELQTLERDLARLVEEDKQLADECTKLKAQLEKERTDHQNAKKELVTVKEKLTSSTNQLKSLEETMKELENQSKTGQANNQSVDAQVASLLPDIAASHERIKKLQAEFDQTTAQCTTLEASNAGLRTQISQQNDLATELQQARAKIPGLIQQVETLKKAEADRKVLEDQLKEEEKKLDEARAKVEEIRKNGGPSGADVGLLSALAKSLWGKTDSQTAKDQQAELEEIERETAEWKAKAERLEETLQELTRARQEDAAQGANGSEYSTGPTSSGRPASSVSDGFDDNGGAQYVPDQRTQTLLKRMRDTVGSLKTKIRDLQEEETTLRAENTELLLELAGVQE